MTRQRPAVVIGLLLFSVTATSCTPSIHPASSPGEQMPVSTAPSDVCPTRCPEPQVPAVLPPEKFVAQEPVREEGEQPAAQLPAEYELDDVRNLPQDIGAYSAAVDGVLAPACRESLAAEFRRRYFSPWNNGGPIFDPSRMIHDINKELGKEWYGENRRRVPRPVMDLLRENSDLGHLPSLNRPAITVTATSMRVLPTARPLFRQADGFPFDMMQQSGVKLNEPLRVLHTSRDGLWVFAETSYASGWIEARDVAYPDDTMMKWWQGADGVVITRDFSPLRDTTGSFVRMAKIGTILPLARETDDSFEVYLAARSEPTGGAQELLARVPKQAAQRHPLAFTGAELARIGNQLIGTPYGWGEMFDDRDCSAMIRDYLLPFGIWLPRGSYDQTHAGTTISLNGKSPEEKARLIMEKGVPFLTLVWLKGHIMLYVGSRDGKPLVFHDLWGVTVKDGAGKSRKQIVGKAVVTTLTPGSELLLASGPLLSKVGKIRIVTDLCGATARR